MTTSEGARPSSGFFCLASSGTMRDMACLTRLGARTNSAPMEKNKTTTIENATTLTTGLGMTSAWQGGVLRGALSAPPLLEIAASHSQELNRILDDGDAL